MRLILAVVLGGLVGYQREASDRPAGFRTHILVALGSALFTLISAFPFDGLEASDPTRIAAQVVTGIGFLGAGTIIRRENIVIGLTTAASLWAVAAVGMAAGIGYYSAAVSGTALILITLAVLKPIERRLAAGAGEISVDVIATADPGVLTDINRSLAELDATVKSASIRRMARDKVEIALVIESPKVIEGVTVVERLGRLEHVLEVNLGLFRKGGSEL